MPRNRYAIRAGCGSRHGDGSAPTTGHQKSNPAPRYSECSNRWMTSLSSDASNIDEKCVPHMTAAKMIQVTTGNEIHLTGRECSTGRITFFRVSADETRSSSV